MEGKASPGTRTHASTSQNLFEAVTCPSHLKRRTPPPGLVTKAHSFAMEVQQLRTRLGGAAPPAPPHAAAGEMLSHPGPSPHLRPRCAHVSVTPGQGRWLGWFSDNCQSAGTARGHGLCAQLLRCLHPTQATHPASRGPRSWGEGLQTVPAILGGARARTVPCIICGKLGHFSEPLSAP